jgi:predicted amidohydrolase YtcJ
VTREGRGTGLHRWGGLKGFVDGSLGSTTAWFHSPYLDDTATRGLQVADTNDLRRWILGADAAHLHVTMHAIGDRANDFILALYEEVARRNGPRDRRFRVEHAQHLSAAAIRRFAALGVVPSMQPFHLVDDGIWAWKRLDSTRLRGTYAFKSLMASRANLSFGSDWTVAPLDPLAGIDAAVNRRTGDGRNPAGWFPEERISVEQALSCYTAGNAYAGFREQERGRIRMGMQADMVVLDRNILALPADSIRTARVMRTIVGGKEVFVR